MPVKYQILAGQRLQQVWSGFTILWDFIKNPSMPPNQTDDIKSITDMKKLPFITRKDLRDNYPFGLFSCP